MPLLITLLTIYLLYYIFEPSIDKTESGYVLFYNWVEGKKKVRKFKIL